MMVNMNMSEICTIVTAMSMLGAFLWRTTLIMVLMTMEMITLNLFLMMINHLTMLSQPVSLCFFMLILGVCEASLGLSLMVMMSRMKGKDMLSMISTFKS